MESKDDYAKKHEVLETVFFSIIKNMILNQTSEKIVFKLIGKIVLYLMNKLEYTSIEKKEFQFNFLTDNIDIVFISPFFYDLFKKILESFGQVIESSDNDISIQNYGIKNTKKITLIITSNNRIIDNTTIPSKLENILSNELYKHLGELKINFNTIILKDTWIDMKFWIIPTLSQNFYAEINDSNFKFGEITDYYYSKRKADLETSLICMIKSLEFYLQTKDKNIETDYSKYYKELRMEKYKGIFSNIHKRIDFVLSGNDLELYDFLKIRYTFVEYLNEKFLKYKLKLPEDTIKIILGNLNSGLNCSICCDDIEKKQHIYVTDCGHIFHTYCVLQGVLKLYYDYYDCLNKNLNSVIQYDIFGNILRGLDFNCPNCRKDVFNIKLNLDNVPFYLFENIYHDFLISKRQYKIKSIFK